MIALNNNSALAQGIKLIGIGKHGSKKLPDELISEITQELKNKKSPDILTGAFVGALMMKDIEPSYLQLEEYTGKGSLANPNILWDNLFSHTPNDLKSIGIKLLNKQLLSKQEAETLGVFLFSENSTSEIFKGMAVSVLRIRYESSEEYEGLYKSILNVSPIATVIFDEKPIIQLAEPFDGVEHSYLITPLLANELQKQGYNVVVSCGRNSGPKLTLNTLDIYEKLNANFLSVNTNTINKKATYGWCLHQKDFFPALDKWVEKRHILMKRPFLAALEKVMNPAKADTLITSVFHIPYLEKMIELGIMAGFKNVIVLKRGLEGTLAPSLAKSTGILCGKITDEGNIIYQSFDATGEEFEKFKLTNDSTLENLTAAENIALINNFIQHGETNNVEFNSRANMAFALYLKGLEWIKNH